MKAIVIDPRSAMTAEVEVNPDDLLNDMYRIIGCQIVTAVWIDDKHSLFVDDEGLLKSPEYFFTIAGYHSPLAGVGIIIGTNDEGESVDCGLTLEDLDVEFYTRDELCTHLSNTA